jgi:hypothetical protein
MGAPGALLAQGRTPARVPVIVPVIVVDLRAAGTAERAASRQQLEAALARHARLRLAPVDPALAAALHGSADAAQHGALAPLQTELDRAEDLRRGGDCQRALDAADAAIAGLAAEQAAAAASPAAPGPSAGSLATAVVQGLQRGYGMVLACAHQLGDSGRALVAAQRLRALGRAAAPPPGVSEELWRAYPAMDALGNAAIVELAITTEPAGAQVWLDHRRVGIAPVTVHVGEGAHLIAAADSARAASQRVQVSQAALPPVAWGQSQVMAVHVPLAPRAAGWPAEAAAVAGWRKAGAVDAAALGALLARLDARFALVIVDADARLIRSGAQAVQAVQIWMLAPGERQARRVGTGQLARPEAIAARVATRADARDGAAGAAPTRASEPRSGPRAEQRPGQAGLDPTVPLLREGDVPRRYGSRHDGRGLARTPWWAYATIIGAVAATSLLILAADLGDDRQRIELRWP